MRKEEIEQITKAAKGGDIAAAAANFLGLDKNDTEGHEAAINGIVDEVVQYNEASPAVRKGIDEYKAAKEPKKVTKAGTTKAKSN